MGCRYLDFHDHVSQVTEFHVTDLDTLSFLLDGDDALPLVSAFQGVRTLDITLVLPKHVWQTMDPQTTESSAHLTDAERGQVSRWTQIGPGLSRLEHLQNVHISLDHPSPSYWWTISEPAILCPLLPLTTNPSISLIIHLPSHANDDTPTPPFTITRRARQEYWLDISTVSIVFEKQFPLVREEEQEFTAFCNEDVELNEYNGDLERAWWRQGEDPREAWRALRRAMDDVMRPCGLCQI